MLLEAFLRVLHVRVIFELSIGGSFLLVLFEARARVGDGRFSVRFSFEPLGLVTPSLGVVLQLVMRLNILVAIQPAWYT